MNFSLHDPAIDLVVLSRDDSALHPEVEQGIASQNKVRLIVHRVIGKRLKKDANRWATIVRARNEGKRRGKSRWFMFLDDDVVLAPDCVRLLFDGLRKRPAFAALAADYLKESHGRMRSPHVAMGAVLFRRSALDQVAFRWSEGQCECLCLCDDLREEQMGISYLQRAQARHISLSEGTNHSISAAREGDIGEERSLDGAGSRSAIVMAAFDHRHCHRFQRQFLRSLRRSGNQERVLAFGYGLYPSEQRQLARLPDVELIALPSNGVHVAIRRLFDFQSALARLPPESIVAYWDAGDVIFQDRLDELWSLARGNPDRLLCAAELLGYPQNKTIRHWVLSIADPQARKYAFDLLSQGPCINSGFAAGTVRSMLQYLQAAHELRHSKALRGTSDWSDQTALNLYCQGDPSRYLLVEDRWNYCLVGGRAQDVRLLPEGRFVRRDSRPISVLHGNGRTLERFAFLGPVA